VAVAGIDAIALRKATTDAADNPDARSAAAPHASGMEFQPIDVLTPAGQLVRIRQVSPAESNASPTAELALQAEQTARVVAVASVTRRNDGLMLVVSLRGAEDAEGVTQRLVEQAQQATGLPVTAVRTNPGRRGRSQDGGRAAGE
jgi:hypothetical protein